MANDKRHDQDPKCFLQPRITATCKQEEGNRFEATQGQYGKASKLITCQSLLSHAMLVPGLAWETSDQCIRPRALTGKPLSRFVSSVRQVHQREASRLNPRISLES